MPLGMIDASILQNIPGINGMVNVPMPQFNLGKPGFLERLKGGLGRINQGIGSSLFPMLGAEAQGLTPQQIQQAQTAARKQLGLGLLSNIGSGRGFGAGLGNAMQFAQGNLQQSQQQAFEAARIKQQQERQAANDARALEQQNLENERAAGAAAREAKRDEVSDYRWGKEQEDTGAWRQTQAAIDREHIAAAERNARLTHPTTGPLGGPRILSDAEAQQLGFAPGSVVEFDGKTHHVRQPGLKTAQQYREDSAALDSAEATFADLKSALSDVSKTGALVGEGKGRLGTAYGNARSAIRVLYNTGVLQPGELPMLQQALENPNSVKSFVDPWSRQQIAAQIDELNKRIVKNKELLKTQFPTMGGGLGAPGYQPGSVGGQQVTLQPNAPATPGGAADFVYSGGRLTRANR